MSPNLVNLDVAGHMQIKIAREQLRVLLGLPRTSSRLDSLTARRIETATFDATVRSAVLARVPSDRRSF